MTPPAPWQRTLRPLVTSSDATMRMFCFPPAGAGASTYAAWAPYLPPTLELWAVQLPGREDRLDEEPLTSISSAARTVALSLQWLHDQPYLMFGHSLGALLAYEIIRLLERQGTPTPHHLIASGCAAPSAHCPKEIALDTDIEVREEAQRLGMSPQLLTGNDHSQQLLAVLRADLRMFYSYVSRPDSAITCPITGCLGASDPHVSATENDAWAKHTSRYLTTHKFPGQHDYYQDQWASLARVVEDSMRRAVQ
ncbi:thioesterase II family protein [Streptomyces sp. NPDC059680]|uniref:thioesterase II family protein n=1 Tax=Streptomyces sp. NPDC059680 TaxID=3346904 RepID=UPI0036B04B85